jgi:hypothetical protein
MPALTFPGSENVYYNNPNLIITEADSFNMLPKDSKPKATAPTPPEESEIIASQTLLSKLRMNREMTKPTSEEEA